MLSPSRSMELADDENRTKMSLPKTLELLDDGQMQRLISVAAEDFRLKFELKSRLRQKKLALAEFGERHQGRENGCALCPLNFHFYRRPVICERCGRKVCKSCFSDEAVCNLCKELKVLEYQNREWQVLCPFDESTFGYAKMVAADYNPSHDVRAQLEFHLIHFLGQELDSASVAIVVLDNKLELVRQQLTMNLLNFSSASHFAFIDDSILEAKKIIHCRSNCIHDTKVQVESLTYCHHLSNAIISVLVSQDSLTRQNGTVCGKNRIRPFFPKLSDSDLDDLGDVPEYSLSMNWLMKPKFSSPRGSMRSQMTSRVVNSIATPNFFKYGRSSEENERQAPVIDDDDDESGYQSSKNSDRPDSGISLAVFMQRQKVEARCGQVVRIQCKIVAENDANVDVLWFNRHKQLTNGKSRVRIGRGKGDSWLEIFDCNSAEDAGEIVCVAISDFEIATDACVLTVQEEDLAGEEPFFIESLGICRQKTSQVRAGSTIELKARIIGFPQPFVSFFKDNQLIDLADAKFVVDHLDDTWTLRIHNCDQSDEGLYMAVAANRIHRATSKFRISVISNHPADSEGTS